MSVLSRKISAGANYVILILIILGFLALINFLSTRHFSRMDLTENKVYTLSDASKKVASSLDDIVTIRCYFSKKLPPYLINLKQKTNDMLDEYKAYAKGNIQIFFLDPAEDPEMQNKMRFIGIPQVQMNILEKDQATSTNVYMGIAIGYEDKQEVVPFIKNTNNLEYDLTSAILKVTREEKKTVGFLSSPDGEDVFKKYQTVHSALERQYAVEKIDISEGKPVPAHVDLMIVAGPENLPERDKYEIDQYIMRGGKVIFLVDIITISGGSIQASYRETNLIDLLEHYGVKLTKNLVLDQINTQITFQTGYTVIRTPYPFYPKIIKEGFDPDHPIVNQLESMIFPWVSALEVLQDTHEDLQFKVLVQSSEYSWLQKGMYNLNPNQQFMPSKEDIKPYPLAVLASGRFKSFYADKEIPPAKESEEKAAENPETLSQSAEENQMLIVSNSRFVESNFANQAGNIEFLLNAVDWFTWGKDLIGIRSRRITDRPLPILSERHKTAIKFANIMAVSILVAILGIIRFYIKKKKKLKLKNLH